MKYYLDQLEASLEKDLPLLALIGTFAAIDIITTVDSEGEKTSAAKRYFENIK